MKNKKLIVLCALIVIIFFIAIALFGGKISDLDNRIFMCVFVLVFFPVMYLSLFLYIKILKHFSINTNIEIEDIFSFMFLPTISALNTDIFKKKNSKLNSIYNFFGNIFITIFYILILLLIFVLSFFVTYFITFYIIKPII